MLIIEPEELNPHKNRPLFFMDVKIHPDKPAAKIIFYDRDSPRMMARRFVEHHSKIII